MSSIRLRLGCAAWLLSCVCLLASSGCNAKSVERFPDGRPVPPPKKTDEASPAVNAEPNDVEPASGASNSSEPVDEVDAQTLAIWQLTAAGAKLTSGKDDMTSVEFRDVPITDALAESVSKLNRVFKLAIYKSEMTDAGWATLAGGPISSKVFPGAEHSRGVRGLQHLDLRGCPVSNRQLISIASGKTRLRSLRLNGTSQANNQVDDDGLAAVLPTLPALKVLAADALWVSEDSLSKLAKPEVLIELYLAKTLVEDEALRVIAGMKSLRKLRLAGTAVSGIGLAELETLPLEDLDLSECQNFDDPSMESIGKLRSLNKLNLWRTKVSDSGVAHLANLTNLTWLNLDNIPFSDAGLEHLATMQSLSFLHLGSTQVTDGGMSKLVGLKSLSDLRVTRTAVTEAGVEPLKKALPGIKIQIKYIEGK